MFDPWAAIGRALLEVAAIAAMVFSVVEKLLRATHGTDAVGVTSRPVASPANDWAAEIHSAATCLTLRSAMAEPRWMSLYREYSQSHY